MVSGLNIEHTFGIRATEKWLSANKLDGFVLQIQPWPVIGLLAPHRSTLRRRQQVIDASWPLERHASGHPAAGEPFNKWWNNKNRKSYFLTKAFYLKKKTKKRGGGDGWGLKVTAVVYDCYWTDHILNKCPYHSCLCSRARSPARHSLSCPLCRRWMCVCVAYDRVMCPGMLVGFISRN